MTLQQLKYVIAVADSGSINKAAKVFFLSQPAVSGAIREPPKPELPWVCRHPGEWHRAQGRRSGGIAVGQEQPRQIHRHL